MSPIISTLTHNWTAGGGGDPYFIRSASYNPGNMGAGGIGIAAGDAIFQGGYIENHGGTSGGRTYAHKFDKSGNLLWELYQQGRQSYSWFAATHPYNGDNLVMGSDQLCKISSAGSCTKIINWKIFGSSVIQYYGAVGTRESGVDYWYLLCRASNNTSVFKVNADLNTIQWAKRIYDYGEPTWIDTDSSHNVYFGCTTPYGSGNSVVVGSFQSNGTLRWLQRFDKSGDQYAEKGACDSNGNCVMSMKDSGNNNYYYILKVNSSGVKQWSRQIAGNSTEIKDCVINSNGDVFCVGETTSGSYSGAVYMLLNGSNGQTLYSKHALVQDTSHFLKFEKVSLDSEGNAIIAFRSKLLPGDSSTPSFGPKENAGLLKMPLTGTTPTGNISGVVFGNTSGVNNTSEGTSLYNDTSNRTAQGVSGSITQDTHATNTFTADPNLTQNIKTFA